MSGIEKLIQPVENHEQPAGVQQVLKCALGYDLLIGRCGAGFDEFKNGAFLVFVLSSILSKNDKNRRHRSTAKWSLVVLSGEIMTQLLCKCRLASAGISENNRPIHSV